MMIKDNHIDYCKGVREALLQAQEYLKQEKLDIQIEIEARTIRDVEIILETGGAFRILLDNFNVEDLKEAVRFIHGRVETEASGGIHPGNVREYASTGVDYLSMGALTHQIQSIDLSLKSIVLSLECLSLILAAAQQSLQFQNFGFKFKEAARLQDRLLRNARFVLDVFDRSAAGLEHGCCSRIRRCNARANLPKRLQV